MRCKNCGSKNDDNLYICQNCGSPLYDEEDNVEEQEFTRVAPPVRSERQMKAQSGDSQQPPVNRNQNDKKKDSSSSKGLIAVIIILCVVLVAMIVGIVVLATSGSRSKEDETTLPQTTIAEETTADYSHTTEKATTQPAETTSETTTETTTATTTTTTTTAPTTVARYTVSISSNPGGETDGEGEYKSGETAILIARPDDGYEFDGWYMNGSKVSSNTVYKLKVSKNSNLTAKFLVVDDGSEEEELEEE